MELLLTALLCVILASLVYTTFNMQLKGPITNSIYQQEASKHKTALILIPHQDDEINLAGGTIKTMLEANLHVRVVFATTGDNVDNGIRRMNEAIAALNILGVPSEDIIFLGYSNSFLLNAKKHQYNAEDDAIFISNKGIKETYGLPDKPEFCFFQHGQHHLYTKANFRSDLKEVLLLYKPDLIFAVDFDRHRDHRYVSLMFEEALNTILHTPNNTYTPQVFKGFAYNGSYLGAKDYYKHYNLAGTAPATGEFLSNHDYDTDYPPYAWTDRIRFPLTKTVLARTLNSNIIYQALRQHFSQGIIHNAKRIINSDQVFWCRRTDSLSYQSTVTVSSGNAAPLTDFKLVDSPDILAKKPIFTGSWIPSASDKQPWVRFNFACPQDISQIYIYGNSDISSQILSYQITLSNGWEKKEDSLKPHSIATSITMPAQIGITWMEVKILAKRGTNAGINEIEIFNKTNMPASLQFIKLMISDTFAYDYWLDNKITQIPLEIFTHGFSSSPKINYILQEGANCVIKEKFLTIPINCPYVVLRAELTENTKIYDQIILRRKTTIELLFFKLTQLLDMLLTRLEHIIKAKYFKWIIKE